MIKRVLALFHARNLEFIRDRSSLGWNIIFPIILIFGMAIIFSSDQKPLFKVALLKSKSTIETQHPFLNTHYIDFFNIANQNQGIQKIERHQIDMMLDLTKAPLQYWINPSSPKGYIVERLLLASATDQLTRIVADGRKIRYVDWLIPGILGMNIMFSCLFGVGYVIVYYRKTGYLKRLSATPTSALEFLIAQISSRLLLTITTSILVFIGTDIFIGFPMHGNYLSLILIAALGAFSMASMGLMFAARFSNQELVGGLINLAVWPMMILSGVWFSLEGAPRFLQITAQLFPLTHIVDSARQIMLDGATLVDIADSISVLLIMSLLFLIIGATLFKWTQD